MAKPTQSLSGWAASGTIATSIPPAEVALGQQVAKPVPASWLNLFGSWLGFVGRGGEVIPIACATATVNDATAGTVTRFPGGSLGIRLVAGASLPSGMALVFPTMFAPGSANKVSVYVDNITAAGTVTVQWAIYDASATNTGSAAIAATAARSYTAADDGTTVDQPFTTGTGDLSGAAYVAATVLFTNASDAIDFDLLKIHID